MVFMRYHVVTMVFMRYHVVTMAFMTYHVVTIVFTARELPALISLIGQKSGISYSFEQLISGTRFMRLLR